MKILLIEDDVRMAAFVMRGLREVGHNIDHFATGRDGLFVAATEQYDSLIVDRMLPGVDGVTIVRLLRQSNVRVPILFLTTLGEIKDRVEGLEAGADDYLVKPFAFEELLARLNAILRRPPIIEQKTSLRVGDLELNLLERTAHRGEQSIALQAQEFRLLEYLMRNEGKVVTRTMLLEKVWDFHFDPQTSVVETHISRLRSKIDRNFQTELLKTIRGVGYTLRAVP